MIHDELHFDKVLTSDAFSSKINFETIDLNLDKHKTALQETLSEMGFSHNVVSDIMQNLSRILSEETSESTAKAREERDKLGLKHIAYGFYSKNGQLPVTHKRDGDSFASASNSEYEKFAKERGDDGERATPPRDAKDVEDPNGGGGEGAGEQPPQVKPRPGNSKEARKAAAAGSVAADLAVKYADSKEEREEIESQIEDED